MALIPIRTKDQLAIEGARTAALWLRMTSREHRIKARISRRDQSNQTDREALVRLTAKDAQQLNRRTARIAEYVLHDAQVGTTGSLDVGTCIIKRFEAARGSLVFTVDEATTVEELKLLLRGGSISQQEYDAVTKVTIRKDPLKASDHIMGLLSTAQATRGAFMSLSFPTMTKPLSRPLGYWIGLVREFFPESVPTDASR